MPSSSRWTEKWLRRWRGSFCDHATLVGGDTIPSYSMSSPFKTASSTSSSSSSLGLGTRDESGLERCISAVRRLRSAGCAGSKASSVLQELRDNLECKSRAAEGVKKSLFAVVLVLVLHRLLW